MPADDETSPKEPITAPGEMVSDQTNKIVPMSVEASKSSQAPAEDNWETDLCKLAMYIFTVGLGSMQLGLVTLGNTQVAPVIIAKFGWNDDDTKFYNTILSSAGVWGLALGAMLSGHSIRGGRRRAQIVCNIINILACILLQWLTLPTMIVGRILNGFCGGILTTCTAMSIVESTPAKYLGVMGSMTNFFIALGIMSITNVGLILPQDYKNKELMKQDEMWHYVVAVSPLVSFIQLILLLVYVTVEPVQFCLANDKDEECKKLIKKLSKAKCSDDASIEARLQSLKAAGGKKTSGVSLIQSMCNPMYRKATWICLILAICAMQSGLTGIGVYMHRLVSMANKNGSLPLSATAATAIYGASDFLGAFGAMIAMQLLKRKTVFIVGFASMGILLSLSGVLLIYENITMMFIALCCFVFCFASFVGAVLWLYVGECAMDTAMGLITLAFQLSIIQQTMCAEYLMDADSGIGIQGTMFLYASENFLAMIFVIFFVKETSGHSQAEKKMLYVSAETRAKYAINTDPK